MINLLPPENKKELAREENWKIFVISGVLVVVFLVCFSLILSSVNIFISGEMETEKILLEQRKRELENPRVKQLRKNLISFNETLSQLESFYQDQIRYALILEEISETLPPGSYLTTLSLSFQSGEDKISCALSGFSPSRQTLLKLKENLEDKEIFEEIHFPPVNWVKPTDVDFNVNFKINPNLK